MKTCPETAAAPVDEISLSALIGVILLVVRGLAMTTLWPMHGMPILVNQ